MIGFLVLVDKWNPGWDNRLDGRAMSRTDKDKEVDNGEEFGHKENG